MWEGLLEARPSVPLSRQGLAHLFPRRRGFRQSPASAGTSEAECIKYAIRLLAKRPGAGSASATCSSGLSAARRLMSGAPYTNFTYQAGSLDEAAPRSRQGRMASRRTLPARWLHCHSTWLAPPRMSSPSTTSAGPGSSGSKRARARFDGRGCQCRLVRRQRRAWLQLHVSRL